MWTTEDQLKNQEFIDSLKLEQYNKPPLGPKYRNNKSALIVQSEKAKAKRRRRRFLFGRS
jgi:hypothetical protein